MHTTASYCYELKVTECLYCPFGKKKTKKTTISSLDLAHSEQLVVM